MIKNIAYWLAQVYDKINIKWLWPPADHSLF